jgi:hypothetical protein
VVVEESDKTAVTSELQQLTPPSLVREEDVEDGMPSEQAEEESDHGALLLESKNIEEKFLNISLVCIGVLSRQDFG